MPNIDDQLADAVAASEKQTEVVESYFNVKSAELENRMSAKEQAVDNYLQSARAEYPIYRLSKNQKGLITNGMLDDYAKNIAFNITFSIHRTIVSGVPWSSRDDEEKAILTSMGLENVDNFEPNEIHIIKMVWSGWNGDVNVAHTFYQHIESATKLTVACYAKLNSGGVRSYGFNGVTNEWGLCGSHYDGKPGGYIYSHPHVTTPSGELLFTWLAVVAGHVSLDKNNPSWGFYPFLNTLEQSL